MVCKRSLYCWKNGPCASDQTRKQIWEDNIRFRESLRDINQSDHYWSFQISKNLCLCLEGDDFLYNRPLSRRYRSASLQQLHQIDCASVTHDFNGLKFRNCYVHCPLHEFSRGTQTKRADTPIPQSLHKKEQLVKYPLQPLPKQENEKPEYCHRYKNTLTPILKPCMKTKFHSQTNLNSIQNPKSTLLKKSFHSSCEDVNLKVAEARMKSPKNKIEKSINQKSSEGESKKEEEGIKVQKEEIKIKKHKKDLKPIINPPSREKVRDYTPVSRTTRKMIVENKQIPFVTYGCNNNNLDIGSKRTHNVLASKMEVYPNALTAKQKKKDWIMRYIQSEKEFQKKCLPEDLRKRLVNHSSLWSLDQSNREDKQRKVSRHVFPLMNKPVKKVSTNFSQYDSSQYRTYRRPQVYFY